MWARISAHRPPAGTVAASTRRSVRHLIFSATDTVQLRLDPAELGYPITAYVTMALRQRRLDDVAAELAEVPEVIEVLGISGETDLLVQVAARDGDDLYRVAGRLLAIDGVERTTTSLVMRTLVPHRLTPLLERVAGQQPNQRGTSNPVPLPSRDSKV